MASRRVVAMFSGISIFGHADGQSDAGPSPSLTSSKPPVMVKQYWNQDDHDWAYHFPPAHPNEVDETGSWGNVPFYAYDYQAPGTKQVHGYWNEADKDWNFHFPPAWANEVDQTDHHKPYYAFDHQAPGTSKILQCWHSKDKDWSVRVGSCNDGESDQTGKWGPPFYAYVSEFCGWPTPASVGDWKLIGSSNVPRDHEVDVGTRTVTSSQQTHEWSRQVSAGISENFIFEKGHIDYTRGKEMSDAFTNTLEQWIEVKNTDHFPAGTYWQFVIDIQDSCGGATAEGEFTRVTANAAEKPCCLPGYFKSPTSNECISPAATRPSCLSVAV